MTESPRIDPLLSSLSKYRITGILPISGICGIADQMLSTVCWLWEANNLFMYVCVDIMCVTRNREKDSARKNWFFDVFPKLMMVAMSRVTPVVDIVKYRCVVSM